MTNQVFKTSFAGKSLFIFLVFQLFISYSFGQSTYYIDPTYSGAQRNGTQAQPFNSFSDFNWEQGASYLIKSSSSIEATNTIVISANNVTLSSYGSGNRPVINSKVVNGNRVMVVRGDNVKVKNLDVRAPDNGPDNSAGCVIDMIGAHNPVLDNVKTTGGTRGINASQTTGTATVINCHITDTWDDGMYNRINDTVIIENTLVERVNLKYHINPDQTYAGGDCIQFDYITHFELRNVTLDKTYTGGKFCLIADHFETGITENSRLIGAKMQHGVYLGIGNHYIFRNNSLSGCQYGVWNKTVNVELYYNIFKNTGQAAYNGNSQESSKVWNNLFVSCAEAITGWNESMDVRNNIFYNNARNFNVNFSMVSASNNCYSPGQPGNGETSSISSNPMFVNASGGDYRLSSGSPCIDAGAVISGLNADMAGNQVPTGSKSDIGPYEYGSSASVAVNNAPVINFRDPGSLQGGKPAVIDASATTDANGDKLTYTWTSKEGIQLQDANSSVVKFLAPDVDAAGSINFTLTVSDGKDNVSRTINVPVQPYKPNMPQVKVTASEASTFQDPNGPANAFDGNPATRWSAEGDGSTLTATLESAVVLSHVKVAFHNGSYRQGFFDVYASKDKVNWTPLVENASTCGYSEEFQVFDLPSGSVEAYEYVRIIGHANSENNWNSYTDIEVYGTAGNRPPQISVKKPDVIPGAKIATVDASASTDPDGDKLTYKWSSASGVTITTPDSPTLNFLAPDVNAPQTINFDLEVSDGVNTSSSTIDIQVQPYKPEIKQAVLIGALASAFQDPNLPENAIDGDYNTRWSVDGDNQWMTTELESLMTLSHFKVAFHHGDYRKGYFDVYASSDNQNWDLLIQNAETSGLCEGCQAFDVPETKKSQGYKYVKLVGHSNSENSWNSYLEFKVYGNQASSAPVVKVNTPSSIPGARVASLDASASYDPDGKSLSYSWSSPDGIQLSSTTGPKVSFLAPDVNNPQNVHFELTVSDGTETTTSNLSLQVAPYRPNVSKVGVVATEASASQASNVAGNAVDGNLSTRWSANGDNQYLIMELEKSSSLSFFKIAYLNGHYRIGYFDLLGSNDKTNWDMLLQNQSTCGLSEGFQAFEVPSALSGTAYKYVKLVGHSNSENNWNSFIEIGTYGVAAQVVSDNSSDVTTGGGTDVTPDLSSVQNTYYIDPTFTGSTRTGTIDNPFNSFSDFQWQANSAYLIKSSTSIEATSTINVSADNVIFSSYGNGERPVINSKVINGTRVMVVSGNYVKVSNLDVRALDNGPDNSAGCVIDMIRPASPVLENVKTTGGNRGINASQTTGTARIINCHITDTWDDGMYNRINDTVIIENTLVERVNLKYHINPDQTYAGGDCIQFDYVTHFELRNCTLDKTYTGGKFCLIADHFETGITEHSRLIGAERQHGVYLGIGNHYIYRYNTLSGCQYGVWNKTVNVELYYNIFKNTALAAYYGDSPASSKVYNNLFTSCGEGVLGWNETMEVKNNIFYSNSRDLTGNFGNISAGYNCYYPGSPDRSEVNSISADPKFVDPASGNYQLDPLSPCIDAGITLTGIDADMLNNALPAGSSTDIGIFEYAASAYDSGKKAAAAGGITNIDAFASKDFSMYPNPSSGVVNFDFSANLNTNVSRIRIINMNGKLVYEKTFNDGTDKLTINHNWHDGVYIVHVTYDDAVQTTRKLIVSTP